MSMDCWFKSSKKIKFRNEIIEPFERVELDRCDCLRIALEDVIGESINLKITTLSLDILAKTKHNLLNQTNHRLGWCKSLDELLHLLDCYMKVIQDGGDVVFDCWY